MPCTRIFVLTTETPVRSRLFRLWEDLIGITAAIEVSVCGVAWLCFIQPCREPTWKASQQDTACACRCLITYDELIQDTLKSFRVDARTARVLSR